MPKRKEEKEEEEEEEEEESKKNLKIPKLIFTIDISNFPNTIVPTVWFLGGAESAPPRPFQSILEPALKRVKPQLFSPSFLYSSSNSNPHFASTPSFFSSSLSFLFLFLFPSFRAGLFLTDAWHDTGQGH